MHMSISQIDTQIKKYEDDLVIMKSHKKFLDILSIQAGLKPYTPMIAKDDLASVILGDDESHAVHAGSTTVGTRGTLRPTDGGNSTFMTAVGGGASPGKGGSRGGGINRDLSPDKPSDSRGQTFSGSSQRAAAGLRNVVKKAAVTSPNEDKKTTKNTLFSSGQVLKVAKDAKKKQEEEEEDMQEKLEDLDLDDEYEDDVFKVFFMNKLQLLAYSKQLEDDNLFKIRLVQEDELNLEKLRNNAKRSVQIVQD